MADDRTADAQLPGDFGLRQTTFPKQVRCFYTLFYHLFRHEFQRSRALDSNVKRSM